MPFSSSESVNSTNASNIGDLLKEGDFQKGIKITVFVFSPVVVYAGQRFVNRGRVQKR